MTRKFKKIEPKAYWVPEKVGEQIEGEVTKKGIIVQTVYGEMDVVEFVTNDGEVLRIGVSGGLKNSLEQVKVKEYIKITYKGEEFNKKTKRRYKAYDVEVARDEEPDNDALS